MRQTHRERRLLEQVDRPVPAVVASMTTSASGPALLTASSNVTGSFAMQTHETFSPSPVIV
jgi:hypothetical protein